MGRELKRVPLDFNWPLGEAWIGYINEHNDHRRSCASCNGTGVTTARQRLGDLMGLLMLSGHDSVRGKCHPYFNDAPLYHTSGAIPSKDMAELTEGLAGRTMVSRPMGHDSSDQWQAERKIIAAAGLRKTWGYCPRCKGHGAVWDSVQDRRRASRWRKKEPPKGEGYQIWETVSKGSPISPVFAAPEELADWMAMPGNGWEVDEGVTRDEWLRFVNGPGWAPSFVSSSTGLVNGVQA